MEDKKESRSKDYYEILGIQKQATDSEIKKAYRKLAIKWHPDKNPGNKEDSEQMFQLISEAYGILSNLTLRKLYDDHGLNALVPGFKPKNEPSQGKNRQYDSYEIFKKFFGDENPFQDMGFNKTLDFNGYKKKSSPKKKKIETVVTSLPCTLEELSRGAEKNIKITRSRYCGNKKTQRDEVKLLSIKILPGWKEGTRITFHGEGDDNVDSLPGDITFIIRELKHENFIRDGNDLIHTTDISLLEALTDCLLKLPTIDQRYVLLACPEVIHPRYERRIQGGGMPNQKTEKRGDLIIRFKINFPQKISQSTKSKLKSILQD